jgi:iron complex outermembrane recepter protein
MMPGSLERAPLDLIARHLLVVGSQDDIGARQRASANTGAALSLTFISSALLLSDDARAQTTPPTLPPVEVVGTTPLIGSGLDRNLVPAQTTILNQPDLRREGMPQLVRSLEREVGSVSSVSASGNPFQPTLFYRGFAASPLQGTPQGLAVYLNGMRFNQPFGDTVYWDLIPDVAIDSVNLEGSNPVFGLNALGGSINVRLKNGFSFKGLETAVAGGSFGHVQGEFQFGTRSENVATYVAGSALHQNGWRDLQSSDFQNMFADIGWRSQKAELHFNVTSANSNLNGPGTAPVQLLAAAPNAQFTAPNLIANTYAAANLSANIDLGDTLSLQALGYYRYFQQRVVNGNAPNDLPCQDDDNAGLLCFSGGLSTTVGGGLISDFLGGGQYGQLDTQNTSTHAYGGSLQLTDTGKLFGRDNHFVVGASLDIGRTRFNAVSFLGGLTFSDRSFVGPGVVIDEPGSNAPVSVAVDSVDWGIYFANTWRVTPQLALTASGRLNISTITLNDLAGGDINGSHNFVHFNPAGGFTYEFAPWLTVYGGYAVANRTPTPAELSCAGPTNSCSLANFFVGDPPLNQVVSRTFEAGLRGSVPVFNDGRLRYSLALYRSDVDDDIAFINSTVSGRAFFANVGSTRRHGLDAGLKLTTDRWLAYLNYSFIDATFQSTFVQASGDNPAADPNGNITVRPGNRLPGIPSHQLKAGAYYKATDKWTVGANFVYTGSVYLFGDDANLVAPLPPYATLDLTTTYQLLPNVQLFAWARNVTNSWYYNFGTFSPTSSVPIAQAPGATATPSYSLAAPTTIYGGVRITF